MIITDIFQESRDLVDASATSYPDAKLLRRNNANMEDVVGDLINADGTWQFDDTNYTSLPIGTATLIEAQSSYTFDGTFLEVENVKILDLNNHWHILDPWDQSQSDIPIENYQITPAFPRLYDKEANTISLLPPPTGTVITLTNGLKVQFKRTARLWTTADISTGTISPGWASPFHILLAYKNALPYALTYKKDRVAFIQGEIARIRQAMLDHYGQREKDKRKVMRPNRIRFR